MIKLVLGVTGPGSSRLLDGQVKYFISKGYKVYLLSPDHPKEHLFCKREGCTHLPVKISKEIDPGSDVKAVIQIIGHLRKVRPDIINVGTPKMGLLGLLAAWWLKIPNRIYTCRGLRYESESGAKRWLLKKVELLTVALAKQVIYVGNSIKETSMQNNTCFPEKSIVIGKGSSNGVNLQYFNRKNVDEIERERLIQIHSLKGTFVIGYVGRVSLHKGTYELVSVFEDLYHLNQQLRLVLIGHFDCTQELKNRIKSHPGIIYFEFQDNVPLFMSLFHLFVLPSWREGFSNVAIQAAAMGLPVITTNATGCRDAVNHEFNGVIFSVRSNEDLKASLESYIHNPLRIERHSENSLVWAEKFKSENVWDGLGKIYEGIIH